MTPELRLGQGLTRQVDAIDSRPDGPVAIAVSGGSDSTALLVLASMWNETTGRSLIVLSVDHGLRPASAREATDVQRLAQSMGHSAEILTWRAPRSGQRAARQARHDLLAQAARRHGARVLMFGHTLDDVAETMLLRRRRGVRSARLAGPVFASGSPAWPSGRGVALLRPLLLCPRLALQDFLRRGGFRWIDDPSNESDVYERARIRNWLARHPLLKRLVMDLAQDALRRRVAFDAQVGRVLQDKSNVAVDPSGLIGFQSEKLDNDIRFAALQTLVRIAGGHGQPVRAGRLRSVVDALKRPGDRATISGAWLQRSRHGMLIGREPGKDAATWNNGVWDGRYVELPGAQPETDKLHPLVRERFPKRPAVREIISDRIAFEGCLMALNEMAISDPPLRS